MKVPDIKYELNYCKKCIQITNHLNSKCQKCKYIEENKMLRQAISVSVNELRKMADDLEKESKESEFPIDNNQQWSMPIINKIPKCSDTWKFEK